MDMKTSLAAKQIQNIILTPSMRQSLDILKMNSHELTALINEKLLENPLLEYSENGDASTYNAGNFKSDIPQVSDTSLEKELVFQLRTSAHPPWVTKLGEYIIGCIDPNGYLTEKIQVIAGRLHLSTHQVLKVVRLIQTFEPAGVCARSLEECLLIQLKKSFPDQRCAEILIKNHLQDLADGKLESIIKQTGFSPKKIRDAVSLIRTLNPKPGAAYGDSATQYAVPEINVRKSADALIVELVNSPARVKISELYPSYLTEDQQNRQYIKNELNHARQLINCINQRTHTIYLVACHIVEYQRSFFMDGTPPLPLTLREVAAELGVNASTVSRTVSGKYLIFNQKVYSFRYFFPSRLESGNSSEEVKKSLLQLIESEDRRHPLSDSDIVRLLQIKGIKIARRTIAKYRAEKNIPSVERRKRRYQ